MSRSEIDRRLDQLIEDYDAMADLYGSERTLKLRMKERRAENCKTGKKRRGRGPSFKIDDDVVRLAPIALYTSYMDVWQAIQVVREVVQSGAYTAVGASRNAVS